MTRKYTLCISSFARDDGSVRIASAIGKNKRSVINRCIVEPDTVAIVNDNQSTVYYLYRVHPTGRSELIGWIQEVER